MLCEVMARGKKGVTYKKNHCSLGQGQGAVNPKINISLIEARCQAVSHTTAVRGTSSLYIDGAEEEDLDSLPAQWWLPDDQTLFCQVCQIPQTQFGPGIV